MKVLHKNLVYLFVIFVVVTVLTVNPLLGQLGPFTYFMGSFMTSLIFIYAPLKLLSIVVRRAWSFARTHLTAKAVEEVKSKHE